MKLKKFVQLGESLVSLREEKSDDSLNFQVSYFSGVTEGVFDDNKRKVTVTVLKEGTSFNKFHYGEKALNDVSEHLNNTAKKVYMNHVPKDSKEPRKVEEWIADVTKSYVVSEGGVRKVKADITVHSNGPNAWVYERMKTNPNDFGPSIIGKAKVTNGVINGEKVKLVESIPILKSFDIVADPSAGGKIDTVYESIFWDDNETDISEELSTYINKINKRKAEREVSDAFYSLIYVFEEMMGDLVLARGDYEYISIDDRRKEIIPAFEEMKKLILKLKFLDPKKEETPNEEKPVVSKEEKIIESKQIEESKDMTLKELKEKYPELYSSIVSEAVEQHKLETKSDELKNTNASLVSENTDLKKENSQLKEDKNDLDSKLVAANDSLKKYKDKEILEAKSNIINEVIKTVGLSESQVTEHFKSRLNEISFSESDSGEEFKKKVQIECEDRLKVIKESKGNKPIVNNGPDTSKKIDVVEEKKYPLDTKTFVKSIRG